MWNYFYELFHQQSFEKAKCLIKLLKFELINSIDDAI